LLDGAPNIGAVEGAVVGAAVLSDVAPITAIGTAAPKVGVDDVAGLAGADEAPNVNADGVGFVIIVDVVEGVLAMLAVVSGGTTAAGALTVVTASGTLVSLAGGMLNDNGFDVAAPPNRDVMGVLVAGADAPLNTNDAVVGAVAGVPTTEAN
jgi:hypothetical protein